jgi:hypothetical protein
MVLKTVSLHLTLTMGLMVIVLKTMHSDVCCELLFGMKEDGDGLFFLTKLTVKVIFYSKGIVCCICFDQN